MVLEENHGYSSVIGTTAMPYLNGLVGQYGLATNYYANTHPSIGNYFMLTTGQIITNNDGYVPPTGGLNVDNVVRQLLLAGKTWKAYAESLPSVGYLGGDSGSYSKHHNPFVYFSDVVSSSTQKLNVVPFTQFASDLANNQLPDYSFVIPNKCNDAHDCSLTVADNWLKANIDPLVQSAGFKQDGLLIILFDEANSGDATNGGGHIVWVAAGPKVKPGFKSNTLYQHQSTLRLSMQALGISSGFPGAAASAPQMGEFFVTSTSTPLPPTAVLTVTPSSGIAPLTVTADSSGSSDPNGTIVSRTIDFGDGSTPATSVTASHSYKSVGSYTVTLTVKDNTSLTGTAKKTVSVTAADVAPTAVLTVSPQSGVAPLAVSADSSGSSDPDGTIVSRKINFGDGTVVTTSAASHTYGNAGSYIVTLSVTDNAGLVSTTTKTVTVSSGGVLKPPTAVLTVSPQKGAVPLTVQADSSGSSDSDGTIVSRVIDFGDGTKATTVTASHTYTTAGSYTVTLRVTDISVLASATTENVTAAVSTRMRGSSEPRMPIHAAAGAIPSAKPSTRWDHLVNRLV